MKPYEQIQEVRQKTCRGCSAVGELWSYLAASLPRGRLASEGP